MMQTELAFIPAWNLAKMIQGRQLSPVELVDHFLERISYLNPKLNAYLTVCEDGARAAAKEAEKSVMKGEGLPLLHGVPISVKDLIFTKGIRTTGGSLVHKDFVPDEDAVAVERLRRAGAIILGKTNTPELGQSSTTENRLGEDCCNPWNLERTCGGSSGGAAAAVASGLGPLALGSDGGGSIRVPAAFCGVYGLKPTHGRVPLYGGFGNMPLFATMGPICRTVRDAAFMLSVISGHDPRDPCSMRGETADFMAALEGEMGELHVAWSPDLGFARVDPEVRATALAGARVFESLGCKVEEATPDIDEPFPIFAPIVLADEYAVSGQLLEEDVDALVPYVKSTLSAGKQVMGYQYSQALRALERFKLRMALFFDRFDLLLTPSTAVVAFPLRQRPREIDGKPVGTLWGSFPFTAAFNLSGQPAATVPCGFSSGGLPVGLQIVARWGEEATVLQASAAFEEARPWRDRIPPFAEIRTTA
jgi:aspartyl-tRNA(Asn)/glutamyl-tRNA(Gln) amidotransferase subunit A